MTKKNKASKINHKRQDYLLSILDRSKNGNLQQEKVIEESDYNSLIAKGCKEYKLYILNQILDGRKYTEEDFRRFSFHFEGNGFRYILQFILQNLRNSTIPSSRISEDEMLTMINICKKIKMEEKKIKKQEGGL